MDALSVCSLLEMTRQVATALRHLSQLNLVHRVSKHNSAYVRNHCVQFVSDELTWHYVRRSV